MNIIFTCNAESTDVCLTEINRMLSDTKLVKWIDGGIGILNTDYEFEEFSLKIKAEAYFFYDTYFQFSIRLV